MKIILAQGNPGKEYEQTRHNVGFLAIDYFANQSNASFQNKSKFHADIAELTTSGQKILLVKPSTSYNDTGIAARALADFYKVDTADIMVIHDELALPFGTIRTREKGSDAGNNGIKSLNSHLGQSYARIRVGVWNELSGRMNAADFVLSRFSADEATTLKKDIFPKITDVIEEFITGNHQPTSHTI